MCKKILDLIQFSMHKILN